MSRNQPKKSDEKVVLRPLLKDLSPDKLCQHMNLFNGPSTKVKVGCSRIFTLPKNLLSYYFKFFEVTLDSSSTEGFEESVELKDCNEQDFELVVQWCCTGQIILRPDHPQQDNSRKIDRLLDFLVLADFLQISTSTDSVLHQMETILTADPNALTLEHIRKAINRFPGQKNHAVRQIFANAAIDDWKCSFGGGQRASSHSSSLFKFQKEVNSSEAFASDILKALRLGPFERLADLTKEVRLD